MDGNQASLFPFDEDSGRPHVELPALWLELPGPEQDVAVSSRIRLARNVEDFHFKTRFQEGEGERLEASLRDVIGQLQPELHYHCMNDLSVTEREVMFERHLVSRELVTSDQRRGVAFSADGTVSLMVNEEDHLRLAVFAPGLDLSSLTARADELDDHLAERLAFAFDPRYGFLTSCPTNTGTGLRVSVMLHLPALSFRSAKRRGRGRRSRDIMRVHNAARDLDLTVRGMHGESSRAEGDFYQLSNQVTLGRTVEEIVASVNELSQRVVAWERSARKIHYQENRLAMEDLVWRAFAVLRHARRLSSSEALKHLSALRLGLCLGILDDVPLEMSLLARLMVVMRPGHLQLRVASDLGPEKRDEVRADLVRATLSQAGPPS